MTMIAPTERYTPPLSCAKLVFRVRTSLRNAFFSCRFMLDLSKALISSNLWSKILASADSTASFLAVEVEAFALLSARN